MNVFFVIVGFLFLILWAIINATVITTVSVERMKDGFIKRQNLVGKIFTNIFYAPAWLFKGIKFVALRVIK